MKKKVIRLFSTLLMLAVLFTLTSCEGNDVDAPSPSPEIELEEPTVVGEIQSYGDFAAVLVPEGWTLGTYREETYYISVKYSNSRYIELTNFYDNEGGMKSLYDYSKSIYTDEQTEISGTYNGITWVGFQYHETAQLYSFIVYTTDLGLNYLEASGIGYAFDSPEAEAILSSIVMAQ